MWKRLLCAAMLVCCSSGVLAQDPYPTKPIRIVLGFSPGGADDYLARLIAPKLTERLGQPVIVENRPGAASTVAAEFTARAAPDGYTLMLGSSTPLSSSPSLYSRVGYDLLKDFSYISTLAASGNVLLAHPSLPAKSLPELVALARAKPKSIAYGSSGVASIAHLAMEMLQIHAGVEFLHVPYKGGGQVVGAITAGEVMIGFSSIATATSMIKAKRLNALALSAAKRNGSGLPDVPTVAEAGYPTYDVTNTLGLFGPAGLPAPVVKLLNAEIRAIAQSEDFKTRIAAQELGAVASSPEEHLAIMRTEMAQWARVIKSANITAN